MKEISPYKIPKLFVYECQGPQPPCGEPNSDAFLGLWREPPYYYLFFAAPALASVRCWLEAQPGWQLRDLIELDYDCWQQIAPAKLQIGPFVIRSGLPPLYHTGSSIPIHIHTGLVFGSGVHPSTQVCLMALADFYCRYAPRSAVDLGTGTGILAVACARLGASQVWALDSNPLAAREARQNVLLNRQQHIIQVLVGLGLEAVKAKAELLIMNLEWPSLCWILSGEDWKNYAWVVLGGFLRAQLPDIQRSMPANANVLLEVELNDWMALALQLRSSAIKTPCYASGPPW
jgi:ribosomal protein L11 methyltransferase